MAEIYVLDVPLHREELLSLMPFISEKRRKRFYNIKSEKAQLFLIASEALLAHALSKALPLSYQTDQKGKPFIDGAPHFNISHSGQFAVCAVSENPIGVDTEVISRMSLKTAERYLSEVEKTELSSTNENEIQNFLCEKWVRKESYIKLLGDGLRLPLNSFSFKGDLFLGEGQIFSSCFSLSENQLIGVCSRDPICINFHTVCKDDFSKLR